MKTATDFVSSIDKGIFIRYHGKLLNIDNNIVIINRKRGIWIYV